MSAKPKEPEVVEAQVVEPGTGALARVEQTQPSAIAAMLQTALEKGIPVEGIEKLVMLHERVSDRAAAQEFAAALADFQRACPPIPHNKGAAFVTKAGAKVEYSYASLDEIARDAGPLLHERGFSYGWDSKLDEKGTLTCVCTLRHLNGHSTTATFSCPTASDAAMSAPQKVAAALKFAERQTLSQVLGLSTCDPDDDAGESEGREPISEEQFATLESLITEVGADRKRFLSYLGVEKLEDVTRAAYRGAVTALEQKRKGGR